MIVGSAPFQARCGTNFEHDVRSAEAEAVGAPNVGSTGGGRAGKGGFAGAAAQHSNRRPLSCRDLETLCLIGQGSAALVYLVRCTVTGSISALKVQRKEDHARSVDRVQMEREVMVDARHPLVAPLYSAFQDSCYLYLNMEYCCGGSLDNFVRFVVRRNLTEDEMRFYAAEIALGLEFLHSKGFVYRDLKAANVLVAASGHVKLTDFGIAERGKIRIETDDRMWEETALESTVPQPTECLNSMLLPRTRSSPGLSQSATAVPKDPPIPDPNSSAPASRYLSHAQTPSPSQPHLAKDTTTKWSVIAARRDADVSDEMSGCGTMRHVKASPCTSTFRRRKSYSELPALIPPKPASAVAATPPRPPGHRWRQIRNKVIHSPSSKSSVLKRTGAKAVDQEGGSKPQRYTRVPDAEPRGKMERTADALDLSSNMTNPHSLGSAERNKTCPATSQTSVSLTEDTWRLSGSPEYMAPEVLMHAPQGSAVDWWGLGILCYELLLGQTPFASDAGKIRATYLNIMNANAQFPESDKGERGNVSNVCQDFIRALLVKDPRGRAGSHGASEVKRHPFFAEICWNSLLMQGAPLAPDRANESARPCPLLVENTSGWEWSAEIAALEGREEHEECPMPHRSEARPDDRCCSDKGNKSRGKWWPFDRFNWIEDDSKAGSKCPVPLAVSGMEKPSTGIFAVRRTRSCATFAGGAGEGSVPFLSSSESTALHAPGF